jgi:uncharacterized protein YdaU (DUF1376 family)
MSSPPWFPFYHDNYLADTMRFSTLEHGVYLLLMLHYWREGGLPNDESKLRRITQTTPKEWAQCLPAVSEKFGPNWRHNRIDKELKKANDAYQRRAEAGRLGGSAKASNAKAMLQQGSGNVMLEQCSGNPSGCGSGSNSSSTSSKIVSIQDREDSVIESLRTRGAA